MEAIAHEAGITQAYVFRMFGTKKALFMELVGAAFDRFSDGMSHAAQGARGLSALALMGAQYYQLLADRTTLLLQLQGFAACGDSEVRDLVRTRLAHMWDTVGDTAGLDPVRPRGCALVSMRVCSSTSPRTRTDEIRRPGRSPEDPVRRSRHRRRSPQNCSTVSVDFRTKLVSASSPSAGRM